MQPGCVLRLQIWHFSYTVHTQQEQMKERKKGGKKERKKERRQVWGRRQQSCGVAYRLFRLLPLDGAFEDG
jgi:hypothetical protein